MNARAPWLHATSTGTRLRPETARLLARAHSPLTGISAALDTVVPSTDDPRRTLITGRIDQHTAGIADSYDGAMTTALAETLERYALGTPRTALTASPHDLAGTRILTPPALRYFTSEQLSTPGFPFTALSPDTPISWLPARSLRDGTVAWVPAQTVVPTDEPAFTFTTSAGTAAHTGFPAALRNAVLELIQTDAAMGTWFGATDPIPLDLNASPRTATSRQAVNRRLRRDGPSPRFYWLPAPDLPAITVACVLESPQVPTFAVGLACHTHLNRALYKAFLECTAVTRLATALALRHRHVDPSQIYDLDSNVAYYATATPPAKFPATPGTTPDALPPDTTLNSIDIDIACIDLTPPDVRSLGYRVVRAYSPDLLPLTPPSTPPEANPRLNAYGGLTNKAPHPYA
ncbi:YcaO-like family protein [Actinomadura harenae]|uniref:YcaO domain-containing protein n=1 Tax=Actinomadura harenae TaxID=2483351 RepID=A0A3M2LN95_9ACTN|nr:YcaO-like family protein [Actinomadura harenae]RMI38941.1 hypothetical protein EBO15_31215 [Actinomadura harenae]